jgi:hypothetical protein
MSAWNNLQPADSYDKVISMIQQAGDWTPMPSTQDMQNLRVADFRGAIGNAVLHISLSQQSQVTLLIVAAPR